MHGMSRWTVLTVCGMERRAGEELAQSVEVAYDGAGRPVSYTDQDGRARKFERDAFGRVVKEIFPDATEVGYAYDGAGRLSSVLDENRHRIQFGWDAFGLASRATAAGQVTDYVRDDYGLLKEVVSSRGGRADRTVKREYDKFDRPVKVVYGPGEVETFAYDAWGRLAKHTRGKKAETYAYDHFGRLAEKSEDGVTTSYAYDAWGLRTRRVTKDAEGKVVSEETRAYDKFGRLSEIASGGKSVRYAYDRAGRVARQVVDGRTIAFEYTRYGRLASKTLLGADGKTAEVRYRYGKDGKIASRRANGVLQNYAYDAKGQLVAVTGEDGTVAERYVYDPAGNILEKEVGGKVTKYRYDGANQLVSSTAPDGTVTKYAYDAAGRMVKEGSRTYRYGYLDKVLSVADGGVRRTFTYHVDGQLATATRTGGSRSRTTETGRAASPLAAAETESFLWDGLALIQRGSTSYVNEPHPNGGSPVLSSSDGVMFNDVLGTTLGTDGADGYAAASLTSFGDPVSGGPRSGADDALFTGKPHVDGLGYAFLFRNYRPGLGKWQTADPLGYPDGWNQLAYCNNDAENSIDLLGCLTKRGSLKFNSKTIQRFVGYQPGSTLSHQIAIYETVTVYDKFEATISYTRVNSHGIADIAVGQITGEWSIYDSIFVNQDNDGMACQTGFSFLFLNFGTRYFSTYADPVIDRSADNKFVSYTYTFNVYSTSYVGADIQIGNVGIDTGINANLPDLRYYGSFNIVLTNQVE